MNFSEFLVPPSPSTVRLAGYDAASKAGFDGKSESREALRRNTKKLAKLHDVFAAQHDRALLVVLQGMDTAGKDGVIKHVMSGTNPQGVSVVSFRKPSEEEVRHDYLWRESKALPERGRIAIFNRAYYEEVLITRVRPEVLDSESAAPSDEEWQNRYDDLNNFERHLTRCGTIVLKFCLHLSKAEQRKRLLCRLETPKKMWKASDSDLEGHGQWDAYASAYEAMLQNTSTPWAPWYVVPADRKWAARAVVGAVVVDALEKLDLHYPEPSPERRELFARLAEKLENEVE
jgi:PPK2 family polyphosphate:nucleotide phosphotransferase